MSSMTIFQNQGSSGDSMNPTPSGWGAAAGILILGGGTGLLFGTFPMIIGSLVGWLGGNEIEYRWRLRYKRRLEDEDPKSEPSGETSSEKETDDSQHKEIKKSTRQDQGSGRRGEAQSLINLGLVAQAQGNNEKAQEYYRNALRIFRKVGDISGEAQALNNLGDTLHSQGELSKAEDYYRESLQMFEETGDRRGMARVWNALATLAMKRGNYDIAEEFYRESLQIYREIGDQSSEAETLGILGYTAESQDDIEDAEEYYQRSLDLASEETEGDWYYLGSSTLSNRRILIPESLFKTGILSPEDNLFWHYEKTHGFRIISKQRIEAEQVVAVNSTQIGSQNRVTVPHEFMSDIDEQSEIRASMSVHARMEEKARYHFVARKNMIDSEPKMCYLMNSFELGEMITGASDREPIDPTDRARIE